MQSKYYEPLNFAVFREGDHLRIRIWQYFWWRAGKALLWSAGWSVVTFAEIQFLGNTLLLSVMLAVSVLMCFGGLIIANFAINDCTLWLRSDILRLRKIQLFTRTTRSFPLASINGFGFGAYSHGGPVLKFESEGNRYVLVQGVIERDVERLIRTIQENGYTIP